MSRGKQYEMMFQLGAQTGNFSRAFKEAQQQIREFQKEISSLSKI